MRCPKCGYISFEGGGRCRNCGYELSLAADPETLDLPIKTGDEPVGPLADFDLAGEEGARTSPPAGRGSTPAARAGGSNDFPLFRDVEEDRPLVSAPSAPRPPVAVRRPAPVPRPESVEEPELDLEPDVVPAPGRTGPAVSARADRSGPRTQAAGAPEAGANESASPVARLLAAAIDLLLLAAMDGLVLYLTLRFAAVEMHEVGLVPVIPFSAFLAILDGGYLIVFTVAGGQTIGKMIAGIKVINADETAAIDRVPFAQAVIRAAGVLLSLLTAGLGFLPGLLSAGKRALHDRLAHTRVVRA